MGTIKYLSVFSWSVLLPWIQAVATEELCPLDSLNCSQVGVYCTIIRDPGCRVAVDWDHTANPRSITDLTIHPYYLPSAITEDSVSRAEIAWSLSTNDTKYVSGFEVRLVKEKNPPYCFIFNISGVDTLDPRIHQYKYVLDCIKLHKGDYVISVTSLPGNTRTTLTALMRIAWKQRDADAGRCRTSMASSCWNTDVVVYIQRCTSQIRVIFPQAPAGVGIEYYQIALMNSSHLVAEAFVEEKQLPGRQFIDKAINISSAKLSLRNQHIEIIPRGRVCSDVCMDSVSPDLDIVGDTQSECLTNPLASNSRALSSGVLASAVVATVLIIGLIVLLPAYIKYRRNNRETGLAQSPTRERRQRSGSQSSVCSREPLIQSSSGTLQPTKTIFVLYSDDWPYHINTIGCLVQVLKSAHCDVIFNQLFTEYLDSDGIRHKTNRIKHYMDISDHILLVNSEGAFYRAEAIRYPSDGRGVRDADVDTFSVGLRVLHDYPVYINKVIMCCFEYTSDVFKKLTLPQFQNLTNYCLIDDINILLCRIYSGDIEVQQPFSREKEALANAVQHAKACIRRTNLRTTALWRSTTFSPDGDADEAPTRTFPEVVRIPAVPPTHPEDIGIDEASVGGLVSDINQCPVYDSGYPTTAYKVDHLGIT